jgi:hypothetical protein
MGSIELPRPKTAGFSLDREELAAALEELVDDLDRKLDAVLDGEAGETVCLVQRDEVLAEFREVRTGAARLLEGIYLAAGLRHLVPGIRHPRAAAAGASRPTAELETTPSHRSPRPPRRSDSHAGASGERSETLGSRPEGSGGGALHETTAPHRFGGDPRRSEDVPEASSRDPGGSGLVPEASSRDLGPGGSETCRRLGRGIRGEERRGHRDHRHVHRHVGPKGVAGERRQGAQPGAGQGGQPEDEGHRADRFHRHAHRQVSK